MSFVLFVLFLVPGWLTGSAIAGMANGGFWYGVLGVVLASIAVTLPKQIASFPPLSPVMAGIWMASLGFYVGGHAGTVWTVGQAAHRPVWLIIVAMVVLLVLDLIGIMIAFQRKVQDVRRRYREAMQVGDRYYRV